MKYSRLTFFALLFWIPFQVISQPLAEIKFETMEHVFGSIKEENGPVSFDFKYTNTGSVPLIIQGVYASCGCTTPEWNQEPILPGKSGSIKVVYNPEMRPGVFNKTVTVNANIPNAARVLSISGEVIPRKKRMEDYYPIDLQTIRLSSLELSFARISENTIKTDSIKFFNPTSQPLSVQFKIIPNHLKISTFPSVIKPKSEGYFLITFDATRKPSYGLVTNRIYFSFNHQEKYDNAIRVSAIVEEDFSKLSPEERANAPKIDFNTRAITFNEVTQGKKVPGEITVYNRGKRDLIIRNITTSCDCTEVNLSTKTIRAGGSASLKITFDTSAELGLQNKVITIISNDPNRATSVIRIVGSIKK